MEMRKTELEGVIECQPKRHGDERGWFSEVWNQATLANLGIDIEWVQDNEARSVAAGTLRGLHFQIDPHAQDKLVRVVAGRVLDVAVDIRRSSSMFGQHVAVELSSDLGNQLLVPRGFAHGYCTMEPDSVIAYKVSGFYSPECDRSLKWDDPDLRIDWPVDAGDAVVSGKDQQAPLFQDIGPSLFD
jgi:dTDP-4-dehydrorhamnose 3,5-epimerase